jgi:Rho-binding antiterminator
MTSEYRPIDCSVHDRLEALATLGRECVLTVRGGPGVEEEEERFVDRIVDVFARGGAEWLRTANGREVRLDRLVRVEEQRG